MPYRNRADQQAAARRHYDRNSALMKMRARAFTNRHVILLAKIIREAKARPCMDCGREYPHYVMDFDHREGERKDANVADVVGRGWSIARTQAEIAKCDVVCANCHRERTHERRQKELAREMIAFLDERQTIWDTASAE